MTHFTLAWSPRARVTRARDFVTGCCVSYKAHCVVDFTSLKIMNALRLKECSVYTQGR